MKEKDVKKKKWKLRFVLKLIGAELLALVLSVALLLGAAWGSVSVIRNLRSKRADAVKGTTCNIEYKAHTFYKYEYAYRTGDMSLLESDEDWALYKAIKCYLDYAYQFETDAERVKAIHDYMILHCAYDTERYEAKRSDAAGGDIALGSLLAPRPESQKAQGVFLNRLAVCEGYAKAFNICMEMLGIQCVNVVGNFSEDRKEAHIWNAVKLDDEWYVIDVTWDDITPDIKGAVSYPYYNVPDWVMRQTHDYKSTVKAEGTKYSGTEVMWITKGEDEALVDEKLNDYFYNGIGDNVFRVYVKKADGTAWTAKEVKAYGIPFEVPENIMCWCDWDRRKEEENVICFTFQHKISRSLLNEFSGKLLEIVD